MSKAEQFIKDYTMKCSNELCYEEGLGNLYEPWLTPDQALRAVELAREEIKAEIERLIKSYSPIQSSEGKYRIEAYKEVLDIINSNCLNISRSGNSRIEAMKEALRMEYEKGRADVSRDIKPEIDNHKTCGECGYYMLYVKTDGDKDSYGDCASIGMNNECFEGNNHFKDPDEELLQVEGKEKACGYFKVNRPVRVRKYIKDNPIYSNKRSKKQ